MKYTMGEAMGNALNTGSQQCYCYVSDSFCNSLNRVMVRSGPVAQLGARFHGMEEVESSNLSRSTNLSGLAD